MFFESHVISSCIHISTSISIGSADASPNGYAAAGTRSLLLIGNTAAPCSCTISCCTRTPWHGIFSCAAVGDGFPCWQVWTLDSGAMTVTHSWYCSNGLDIYTTLVLLASVTEKQECRDFCSALSTESTTHCVNRYSCARNTPSNGPGIF